MKFRKGMKVSLETRGAGFITTEDATVLHIRKGEVSAGSEGLACVVAGGTPGTLPEGLRGFRVPVCSARHWRSRG